MMKILLVEPSPVGKYGNQRSKGAFGNLKTDIRWPPIDLMVIAGYLRRNAIEPTLIDGGGLRLTPAQIREQALACKPDIIIVSTSTTTIYHDLGLVSALKQACPRALAGVIGVHVMALPSETLALCGDLDFAVYSEPEIPILNLCKRGDLPSVRGVWYRRGSQLLENPPQPALDDLDELGMPAHDLVPLRIYQEPQLKRHPMTVTMVSRGCVNRCVFCSSCFYGRYRVRSVGNIIKELKWITESLRVKELKFYDDGITYDRAWAYELFNAMVREKIDLSWNTNVRADYVDYELASLMKRAGCHTVNFGLESASQEILDKCGKNIDLTAIKRSVSDCKRAGLEVCGYFVLGLPGESRETVAQTARFSTELDLDLATFNVATPHPGTVFYKYLEDNKYLRTRDWSQYDTNSLPVYDYPGLSSREIYRLALRSYRQFYMRPGYLMKRLRRISSWVECKNMFANFAAFLANFLLKSLYK